MRHANIYKSHLSWYNIQVRSTVCLIQHKSPLSQAQNLQNSQQRSNDRLQSLTLSV